MTESEEIQLVTFRCGGQEFACNIFEVERILRHEAPVPLPKAPEFLVGMLGYADGVIPVIDLRKRLGVEAPVRDETRTMVLEWEQGRIGMVVDAVLELMKVTVDDITPPPPLVRGLAAEYINGIIRREERTIVVLAWSKILSSQERLALETLTADTAHGT